MGMQIKPPRPIVSGVDLETLKRLKKNELLEKRKKAIEDGCATIPTRIGPIDFWTSRDAVTDLGHYIQEVGLVIIAGQLAQDITRQWKTASGVLVLPGDVAIQAGKALADWTQAQFSREAVLAYLVDVATMPEAVQAVVWDMELPDVTAP